MVKATILHKRKKSYGSTQKMKLKKNTRVIEYSPTQELLDEDFIAKAIWECLKNNDPDGVIEIIETHLEMVNKVKASKEKELSRSTLYHALKRKNPTVKTLAKLVNCCAA
jgi:DNA-binding phage protein